jgi:hypothetical protein
MTGEKGMIMTRAAHIFTLGAVAASLVLMGSHAAAQVFPPRQPQQAPLQGSSGHPVMPPAPMPPQGGPPAPLTKTIPFAEIIGDATRAYIHIGNMRGPMDTNFQLGRALGGQIPVEKFVDQLGNGKPIYIHVNGLSNPPIVSAAGPELRFQFVIPALVFKTYYGDYSVEGDGKLGDVTAENVTVDVYFTPATDQRRMPTFQTARVVMTGEVKDPDKCTYFFDMIFPVNVCNAAAAYLKEMKPGIENGLREMLHQPQTRMRFDQALWPYLRGELLLQAGVNPASPAQVQIIEGSFRGMDYVVGYLLR